MNAVMIAALGLAALTGSFSVVWFVRVFAGRYLLDIPNARSSHIRPTVRGGGVGIVVVAWFGWAVIALRYNITVPIWPLVGASFLVATISVIDDLRSLPSSIRFGFHALAAVIIIWGYDAPNMIMLPLYGSANIPSPASVLILVFWCLALTNVYNFMDGIDGIAGIQAIIASLGWTFAGLSLGEPLLAGTGIVLMAASLGFLFHNWAPARIFLGDVGSAFLGFCFAALVAVAGDVGAGTIPVAAVLFVWPFVFDGTFTLVRRILRGENIFQAHRSHLYQRQVISGRSHAQTATLYGALAALSVAAGCVWILKVPGAGAIAVGVAIAEALCLLVVTVRCEAKRREYMEQAANSGVAKESSVVPPVEIPVS